MQALTPQLMSPGLRSFDAHPVRRVTEMSGFADVVYLLCISIYSIFGLMWFAAR